MAVVGLDIRFRRPWVDGYEHIVGTMRFAVDPAHTPQIVDLELAPTEDGRVQFSADFALLQPTSGSRKLVFDVLNRGTARALAVFNEGGGEPCSGEELDPGNGFLMRRGYSIAWCGWQQDLPPHQGERMGLYGPALPDSVQGLVLCEFQPPTATDLMELSDLSHKPYPPAGTSGTLTVREHTEAPRQVIPPDQWRFVDDGHIQLEGGLKPGLLYEAVYQAKGARVTGLGLLAVRDVVSWLKYGADAPQPSRALREPQDGASGNVSPQYAYGFGRSQSGRFLRHFLHLGLNEDAAGRQVFDGVMPLVAGARRGEFNVRFGQPSKTLGQGVGALPPFSDRELVPQTGVLRQTQDERAPQVKKMNINSSAEYWGGDRGSGGQASLLHNDGKRDLELPDSSRVYLLAGTQHVGTGIPPEDVTSTGIKGQYAFNCVSYNPYLRAALVNLDRWVSEGVAPPSSRYPRLDDGTAVTPEQAAEVYRRLAFQPPNHLPRLRRMDFGAGLPPELGKPYVHYVSALDADGNEVAGIRPPEVSVPVATHTGWNVRHPDVGAPGELIAMTGATIPFTPEAIAVRYKNKKDYLQQGRAAAEPLVRERYILEEDVEGILGRMERLWDLYGPHS